jgi:hypothetical protein
VVFILLDEIRIVGGERMGCEINLFLLPQEVLLITSFVV